MRVEHEGPKRAVHRRDGEVGGERLAAVAGQQAFGVRGVGAKEQPGRGRHIGHHTHVRHISRDGLFVTRAVRAIGGTPFGHGDLRDLE